MRIGILTSGGDAPGMNSFVYNFVNLATIHNYNLFSVKFGFQGLIDGQINKLNAKDVSNISHLGGSFLKSCRCPEFQTKKGFDAAVKNCKKHLDCLVIIGGNGSLKGTLSLHKAGINVIFIPATIDNDLYYTEKSLGFDSAVNCAVEQIDRIKQTMLSLNRIFICEVMGRECPDIATSCFLATNADLLITNKLEGKLETVFEKINISLKNGVESPTIILKENVLNAEKLANQIQNKFDIETRASVLGYIQRGASPSVFDRIYAKQLADKSLNLIKNSLFGKSLGLTNNKIQEISIEAANSVKNR